MMKSLETEETPQCAGFFHFGVGVMLTGRWPVQGLTSEFSPRAMSPVKYGA